MKRQYKITGLPAFVLCVLPMIVGYVVIIKATLEAIL